jgi:hypothetical protein
MKYVTFAAICSFAFLTSCATPPPTAQQRMSNILSTYDEADKQLAGAEKDLASFEKNVANLRDTAASSKNMRTKAVYDETLARLSANLQQTHLALQDLKATNQIGRAEYQRQIDKAASEMQISSDANQAR